MGPPWAVKRNFDSIILKKKIFEVHVRTKSELRRLLGQNQALPRPCFLRCRGKNLFAPTKTMELIEFSGKISGLPLFGWKKIKDRYKVNVVPLRSCRLFLHLFMFRQPLTRFRMIRGVRRRDLLSHKYQILKVLKKNILVGRWRRLKQMEDPLPSTLFTRKGKPSGLMSLS